jgi:hypothetical protein
MDYRETYVNRALDLIRSYRGYIPYEVRILVGKLDREKDPHSLTSAEFNMLQETADRIDTQIKTSKVQNSMRRKILV